MSDSSLPFQIPEIETARLILRGHRGSDFQSLSEMWAHPDVVKHITGVPSTESHSWARLLNYTGHWAQMGFGYWAVIEKQSGRYIGDIGMADFKRKIEPSMQGRPEMGWILAPPFQGKGFAFEALQAVITWGRKNLKPTSFVCIIDPENQASIRLALKLGFRQIAETTFLDKPTRMYELT